MKTYRVRPEDVVRNWWIVDAEGKTLGRLASQIAKILRGKHKPYYQPDVDCGDFVVVLNAGKVKVTGKKLEQKVYASHTNYPGGIKERTLKWMLENKPEEVIRLAVKRMLPKNRLGHRMLKRLKVYSGSEHPHQAQKPQTLEVKA
ncbi:ribosomal protein L13 [Hydrogenobacter thermophilus TK-6]|uniref:Large ribosomal subunit protein uL13 n=1 Tax=Hydrogenobacter thermophilus (strain DSM 6534 / IAM 12695 / TK-6) TaxID=608538 RepID=D3DGT7_HYDTT|nr:50S ribosomal protein L13 [Hydrogenobacter thermophilus]ADO44975.1 ribosomal protein L13 [Hydrogenobacter thermophilus TK-6]BAI69039.1 ribosomal protein L13 [Hydrogenobacter thermophilus TK-6]